MLPLLICIAVGITALVSFFIGMPMYIIPATVWGLLNEDFKPQPRLLIGLLGGIVVFMCCRAVIALGTFLILPSEDLFITLISTGIVTAGIIGGCAAAYLGHWVLQKAEK